ncbi:hypothetical protein U9M48_007406 [Paspalum notatum var. saurae]|uniref:SAC3/GANP/THP3 conserved domain-containing protein n=1 Tax=Paspalum notatum var. saurae TaxID=547442 RepID=A0AAQ3Q0G6_PASNO
MDRRGEASHRGWGRGRSRSWRGRGRGGAGGERPSPPPPFSTGSPAALHPTPTPTPAVTADDAAPIKGTCLDMCPARERALRERLRDLAVLERAGGDPARTSPSLAVKKVSFHIRSHQRLALSCQDSDASSLCHLNMEQLTKCLLSLYDMYHVLHKCGSHSKNEAEYYSFYVLLHLGCKIPKMIDSVSFWYGQLAIPVRRSKEMVFARTLLRCYRLGNFKLFFRMVAAEATDLQLRLVEPFLNEAIWEPVVSESEKVQN